MKRSIGNALIATTAGALLYALIRMVLRESLVVVERMDRLAQEQARRHAYGPNVAALDVAQQPDAQPDASAAPPDVAHHRFAPGPRPWDDHQLEMIDPLDKVIDDPFSADGQIMMPRFIDRGGQIETDT